MGMPALLLFLSLLIVSKVAYAQDVDCKACVDSGCTFCANSAFGHPDACLCGTSDGFFGGCDDVSFGSEEWNSKWDCNFNSKNGEIILAAIVAAPVIVIILLVLTWFVRRGSIQSTGSPHHGSSSGWMPHHASGMHHHMDHTSAMHHQMDHTMGMTTDATEFGTEIGMGGGMDAGMGGGGMDTMSGV